MTDTTAPAFDPLAHGYTVLGKSGFEAFIGPLFHRPAQDDHEFIIQVAPHHCNVRDDAHGGFVLAVADVFLSASCYLHLHERQQFVTVSLAHDFMGAAPRGAWLRGRGRVRRDGNSLMFAECEFFIGEESIGVARCVMKKVKPRI